MTVHRQSDGRYRWIGVSAASVLNRVGEIDSRDLFDSFIAYAKETGDYPIRMFFHRGEQFRTGQADFLARDDNLLITSGLFDDTEIGRAEAEARMSDPDYWGDSIGYLPMEEPEIVRVNEVEIPVYRNGRLAEISTLPEARAASWFTNSNVTEVRRMMTEVEFEAFAKLFQGDEDQARAWLESNVDPTNRAIAEDGLITRDDGEAEGKPEAEAPEAPEQEVEQPEVQEREIELDDAAVAEIARSVEGLFTERTEAALAPISEQLTELVEAVQTMATNQADIGERLEALEQDESDKQRKWVNDLPRRSKLNITYRPREAHRPEAEELEEQESLADKASKIWEQKVGK